MKKYILIAVIFCFFSGISYSQIPIPGTAYLSGSGYQLVKITVIKNKKEGTPSYDNGTYAIGKEFIPGALDTTVKIYRTYFVLDLNTIPTNATITQVTVNFSTGNIGSYSLKLTQITSVSTDKGANWNTVASGNSLHTAIAYNGSSFVSTPIKNAVQNSLAGRQLIVGSLSESESTNGSYSSMTLSLHVNYTRPAVLLNIDARNDLEGANGGNIGAAKYPTAASSHASPYTIPSIYETDRLNLAAYDNQYVSSTGYTWIFNDSEAPLNPSAWKKDIFNAITPLGSSSSTTTSQLTTSDNGASFVAYLKKICNLTFTSPGGYVYVNNVLYSSPKTSNIVAENSVTAQGQWYFSDGIEYTFNHWTSGGQTFSNPFTATEHKTYTANYIGKPTNTREYAGASYADVGDPIVVTWVDNPNTAVNQFQIWRKVKHDGVTGSPVLLTTVGRGVQTYTDYEYAGTDGYTDDLLWYDVRAYYSTDGTYSDADYQAAFGAPSASTLENTLVATLSNEIPAEYSISNYPNPFNPTTTINYQLPQDGFVTIKVYDMLGKEIATLVDGSRTAGYHNVNFDASRLTSGIYIYTINANNYVQSKKMILMK